MDDAHLEALSRIKEANKEEAKLDSIDLKEPDAIFDIGQQKVKKNWKVRFAIIGLLLFVLVVHLNNVYFRKDFQGIGLQGADWSQKNLAGVNLTNANLRGCNLAGADLTGTNLTGANLINVNLRGASLTKTQLIWVNLIGANLSQADLSQADMSQAKGLDDELLKQIKKQKPDLMKWWKLSQDDINTIYEFDPVNVYKEITTLKRDMKAVKKNLEEINELIGKKKAVLTSLPKDE